ncbi:TRAP transporter small permease subunit [Pseudoalteromonas denitrificans]|jgi:TRAP-type mannitol/chloroaromatic compound transport system permease small subunit|uniref:TRAP transporter small permease protein n=1 Tax=Pseudoalteromonas denitrificans DSM 6059 TaxID=1123010 RepID=A0A1I1IPD3_9GAMM|nr:TRAP transporter small permease subunit [Pseudoalteromonas denitrificans]SFC35633.1 TRAP-type mannitol/chloroaromatic compound transport system, small permease component [Pseudoalteromonas denitrificans DSM 6059]
MLSKLSKIHQKIDQFTESLGKAISWFTVLMVLIMVSIVLLRYGFNIGWIAMQESVLYLHAFVFMLGCSYTLKHNGHVRVDIFYRRFSIKKQAWVNLLGCIFLLFPVTIFISVMSFDYITSSWSVMEGSREAGGLPGVFILKSLIPLLSLTLIIQAISEILKSVEILLGHKN